MTRYILIVNSHLAPLFTETSYSIIEEETPKKAVDAFIKIYPDDIYSVLCYEKIEDFNNKKEPLLRYYND